MIVGTLGVGALFLYADDHRRAVIGYAQGLPEAVGPLETSRVAAIHVGVGDLVTPGQILATLDTSLIDGEIAVAEADKVRLEATVRAERALVDRRLAADVSLLERETLKEREEQLRLDAESKALDAEIERVRVLVAERHAVATDLTQLEIRRASVASLAAHKPTTIVTLSKQTSAASRRLDDASGAAQATTAKLEADLLVVGRKIELLERRRAGMTLRAARRGRVARIDKHPGEAVNAGDSVVSVVSTTDRVIACMPERMSLAVREGDAARLWVKGQRGEPFYGRTVALGPVVSELPTRCWLNPHLPMWGREITIALDTPLDVVAGESFEIALSGEPAAAATTATTITSATAAPAPETSREPRLMTVPTSLTAKTRFEPSAVVALRAEKKYLVVSDDTGRAGHDSGKSWLFAMDASGVVEPDPIAIVGTSEIDDLEAITEDDAGELWVLASQSFSKKGKRKTARTALLRLKREGRGYRVDGETHPAERLEALLGINGSKDLDVEGMAWKGGALFFGVKAPLDGSGNARVVKVASPRAFLEGDGKSASIWATVKLDVDVDGARVPGGISELTFLPDGSLLFASTPSTADGEAGALFHVASPSGGALTPRLVRRFPHHKPEGLAPSLSGSGVMIVFDAGQRTPSFLELPWPSP